MMRLKLFPLVIFSFLLLNAKAQDAGNEKESPFSFGCDIVSRYVWRGVNLGGNTPGLQPSASLSFGSEKHALSFGTFGAFSFGGQQIQEADFILSYTYNDMLNVSFTDYFFPLDDGSGTGYFEYNSDKTAHVVEGVATFKGTEKIPFSLTFAANLYGADARRINADGTAGSIMFSKYVELGYVKKYSAMEMNLFVGAALDDPDLSKGEIGFYGNSSYGVINVGCKLSKEIKINDNFSLPVNTQLIINPEAERIFMVFAISL